MHHALLISEIFREICAMTDEPCLSALARTCRALSDPALDQLWCELYSIYPFIHLLLHDSIDSAQNTQPLSSHQWMTLSKYSARTRSLYMCLVDESPCLSILSCLSNPPNSESFFANLRTLAWYPDTHLAMLPFFRLLCGPALITLSAEFATDPASLATVAALGYLCPNISDICISALGEDPSDDLAGALSTSICHWNDLKHVSCDDLSVSALEHLSQAKKLDSLTACATVHLSSFSQTHSGQKHTFPRLQHLHLYTNLLTTTSACLIGLHLALKEFRLDLFESGELFSDPSCLRHLFTALADACSHACLTRLYLCVIYPHFPSPNTTTTIRDFRSLFSFTRLQVLSLEGLSTCSFTDDDIAELASAWPDMEDLALSTCTNHPFASLPTFQSLLRLRRTCPKLKSLTLVVDTTTPTPAPALDDTTARATVLERLCLGNAPINAPVVVAHVLHHLYPALECVDLSVWNKAPLNRLPRRDRYEACWGMVNIELSQLRGKDTQTRGTLDVVYIPMLACA